MELKIKALKWSAGLPVAMLNYDTAEKIGVHPRDFISIQTLSGRPKEMSAIVDVIKKYVRKNEIAVSSELRKVLGIKIGEKVEVNLATPPRSVDYIKEKLNRKELSQKKIAKIIKDVINNSLSEVEIALFISAIYRYGMTMKETVALIRAICDSGSQMKLRSRIIADKHSVGGVPGNRTTPLVISICAAAGLVMPKTSSRAITSAAGTADVIETVAKVEFSVKEAKKIVQKTGACMVWGGALGMVPADSKIIRIEKTLKIDPEAMLLASIMSKKLAVGSNNILIDIPYGKGAKVNKKRALLLKRKFNILGKKFRRKLECILTDGSQPIGNGVGPALELRDVIAILDPKQTGPEDLKRKALLLAGKLLEMTKKAKKGKGIEMAKEILDSGKAFEKFKEIIKAQHGNLKRLKSAKFTHNIISKRSGKVIEIKNKEINSLARAAGCPVDKSAGICLYYKKGDLVKKNSKILTLHAESRVRLREAIKYYEKTKPVKIG